MAASGTAGDAQVTPDRCLLFTDLVDSTQSVQLLGDARAAELWAEHDRRARDLMAGHGGREIDRSDGFFLLFDNAADGARFAMAYHQALASLALEARVGLHVGPVSLRANDPADVVRGAKPVEVEGLAKPLAARVMALAAGGQTLLSLAARVALGSEPPEGSEIQSHGHYRFKGLAQPIEVFELGLRGRSAFAPPADTGKAYRVLLAGEIWLPLRDVRHNLPAERDAFIGRSRELHTISIRLDAGVRLLTILGPGGTGKTRLVQRYGYGWRGDWPGGVCFCDLSEARSLEGIHAALAAALGLPLSAGDPAVQLGHAIAGRGRCLIVLDNFEHLVQHAAATLGPWLDRAAEAAFVVTSRERLHLAGEEVLVVEPLRLADEAVDLFVVRAQAQQPGFALVKANRDAVSEVVRLLDGLPLAIELAAARSRVLSPSQLVLRMRDRFGLLAGARGAAARQATLRAAIDWSWDLLAPWDQAALAQCSVFEGGFTLEGAEAVLDLASWPRAPPVMDAVQALVDKSLLRTWVPFEAGRHDFDEPYFGMYLSIREYAASKLRSAALGAQHEAEVSHGRYFARFGSEEALRSLSRDGGTKRLRALALERGNLLTACRRAVERQDAPVAVAAYRAAWEVLEMQGPFALGADLGAQVFALDAIPAAERVATANTMALALSRSGRTDEAAGTWQQALELARAVGERRLEGAVLRNLGVLHHRRGRSDEALDEFEAALIICRERGDRPGEGSVLGNLASLLDEQGRVDEALPLYLQALAILREVGNRRDEGVVLGNLGALHADLGHMDEAREHLEQALSLHREAGSRDGEAGVLGNLGVVHHDQGRLDEAQASYEQVLAIHREMGSRNGEAGMLNNLGVLLRHRGRLAEARAHFDRALLISREVGHRRAEGGILASLGALLLEQGLLGHSLEVLRAGEALLRELGERLELAKLLCVRGRAEAAAGEAGRAGSALAESEAAAAALGAAPDSELSHEIAMLRAALA